MPQLLKLQRLMAQKTEFIYGIHAVNHALESAPADALELWMSDKRTQNKELQGIEKMAQKASISIHRIPIRTLEQKAQSPQHQGVVLKRRAASVKSENDLADFLSQLNDAPFLLILDNIQDPHNLGACLRTADASGVHAVIIPRDNSVGLTPTVYKVASGAAETIPVFQVTNLARTLRGLKGDNIWVIGLAGEAEVELHQRDMTGPLALVMGAEGTGLRQNTRKHCDDLIKIPMLGQVESLNVSVATGVVLYEALRQRQRQ